MATKAHGLRLPEDLETEMERERARRGDPPFSELATSLLREALRMRRVPGIVFVDGLDSRRAAVAGTGLEVWEIVAAYKAAGEHTGVGEGFEELAASYPWLSEAQLRAALGYYELYPREIDARLEREERWTVERVWGEYPFMRPGGPVSDESGLDESHSDEPT
ncbi:MAG: DUF433 domain-containing protein [Rubrobacter sp.]|nr:DUF433 domain-containing protein [Rubrobacter sp.]MDQ3302103.1 DUF433 domain-containing protein [Actinomycetota bacterium]